VRGELLVSHKKEGRNCRERTLVKKMGKGVDGSTRVEKGGIDKGELEVGVDAQKECTILGGLKPERKKKKGKGLEGVGGGPWIRPDISGGKEGKRWTHKSEHRDEKGGGVGWQEEEKTKKKGHVEWGYLRRGVA